MTAAVINVTADELHRRRAELEEKYSVDDLRHRVDTETATEDDYIALEQFDEIAFLLGETE